MSIYKDLKFSFDSCKINNGIIIFNQCHSVPEASYFLSNRSATQISPSRSFFLRYVTLRRRFKCGLLRIGPLTCSSNFRVTGNDMRDLRLASPGGHSTQRLISPIGHLRVSSLNDHRVSSPSDSEIRVHSPSKFFFTSITYRPDSSLISSEIFRRVVDQTQGD